MPMLLDSGARRGGTIPRCSIGVSGQEDGRASGLARLEIAMRQGGFAQRIALAELDLEHAAPHQFEQFRASRIALEEIGDMEAEGWARDRERAFLREQEKIDRRYVPRGIAVVNEHAERPDAIKR